MSELKFFKTNENVAIPSFATKQSACFDIAFSREGKFLYKGFDRYNAPVQRHFSGNNLIIMPSDRIMVPTGLIMDIPTGYSVRIHARSGLSLTKGLVLVNSEGIIDSDYVEELFILLTNVSDNSATIISGDRIAQGELVKSLEYTVKETKKEPKIKTDRRGGMGSTGVKTKEKA